MHDEIRPNLQDFSTVDTTIRTIVTEHELQDVSSGFYFFVLDVLFGLQYDEILDCITDTYFLSQHTASKGHDRGIDAVYIEQTETKNKIHLFNFKYSTSFDKTKGLFPSNEIDKITAFLNALMSKDMAYADNVNPVLAEKMKSIWEIFDYENPDFVIHICSNKYYSFEKNEEDRFQREINKHSNFTIKYHLMSELVNLLTKKGKVSVDAKIKAINKEYFDRSDGDVKALIVNFDVVDLLRICIDDESLRLSADIDDYKQLKDKKILEDAFEDNVRVYLKQRSKINRNIKTTALSNENYRLFYYNNGITITCEHFEYPGGNRRSPIIELSNLQVVNGSQTIHALFEAFLENSDKFENMTILCRIYETKNKVLSTNIAEYTNSQNPVKTRDIRSIDYIQIKLEKEFEALGYYYERKKNLYFGKPMSKRLDAEKVGQVLMAFYNKMPAEAKDKKRLIFAEKYDVIFNDSLTAKTILLPIILFKKIESKKSDLRDAIFSNNNNVDLKKYKAEGSLLYGSYWILYVIHELAIYKNIPLSYENYSKIELLYPIAAKIVKDVWFDEYKGSDDVTRVLSYDQFFKKGKPMKYIENYFDSEKIKNYFDP